PAKEARATKAINDSCEREHVFLEAGRVGPVRDFVSRAVFAAAVRCGFARGANGVFVDLDAAFGFDDRTVGIFPAAPATAAPATTAPAAAPVLRDAKTRGEHGGQEQKRLLHS